MSREKSGVEEAGKMLLRLKDLFREVFQIGEGKKLERERSIRAKLIRKIRSRRA